jgi:tellurite resistance protein TehA-like permease
LTLGKAARQNFAITHVLHDVAGDVAYVLGFFVALIMWGFGLVWLVFALASIYKSKPFQFNMGWWGFTFPLGVFSISTITLGVELDSAFFKVFGTVRRHPEIVAFI